MKTALTFGGGSGMLESSRGRDGDTIFDIGLAPAPARLLCHERRPAGAFCLRGVQ